MTQFRKINSKKKTCDQIAAAAAREDTATLRVGRSLDGDYASEAERLKAERVRREKSERQRQNELLSSNY